MKRQRASVIIDTMFRMFKDPIQKVREKTGLARSTISRFFNNSGRLKTSTRNSIYSTCMELIEQKIQEQEQLDERCDMITKRLKNYRY